MTFGGDEAAGDIGGIIGDEGLDGGDNVSVSSFVFFSYHLYILLCCLSVHIFTSLS